MTIVEHISRGAPLIFIGAHPDDEVLVGPLLAFAAERSHAHVQCVTQGQSGWNLADTVCDRTLGQLRVGELEQACRVLGASCQCLGFISGTSTAHASHAVAEDETAASARWKETGEFKQEPEGILQRWSAEDERFPDCLGDCVRRYPNCVCVTFEPERGFTWHPEHRAVGSAATRLLGPAGDGQRNCRLYWVLHPEQRQSSDEVVDVSLMITDAKQNYAETVLGALSMHQTQFGKRHTEKSRTYMTGFKEVVERIILRPVT